MQARELGRKHRPEDAQKHINPHLGQHAAEKRPGGGRQHRVAAWQPVVEREKARLHAKHEQEHRRQQGETEITHQRVGAHAHLGKIHGAKQAVGVTAGRDEQRAAHQIKHEVRPGLAGVFRPGFEGEQRVGRQQHDLEGDEEVEKVAGQKGEIHAREQKHQKRQPQGVLRREFLLRHAIQHASQPGDRGERYQQGGKGVAHQHDAVRQGPATNAQHQGALAHHPGHQKNPGHDQPDQSGGHQGSASGAGTRREKTQQTGQQRSQHGNHKPIGVHAWSSFLPWESWPWSCARASRLASSRNIAASCSARR